MALVLVREPCAVSNHEASSFQACELPLAGEEEVRLPKSLMSPTMKFSFDAPGDGARAAELRRVKALATLVLAGTLALFVIAKMLLPLHPGFGLWRHSRRPRPLAAWQTGTPWWPCFAGRWD